MSFDDLRFTALVLEQREVDLVVTRPFAIPPPEDHFQGELLFTDSVFVIAGIKNPWARRRRIKLADLINEPWALPPPDDQAHELLTDVFRAMGLDLPRPAMVTATGVARIALVAKGHFLSMASESVLKIWWLGMLHQSSANRPRGEWTGWDYHIEEPHIDACGATFHRLRPRGGKANGKASTPASSKAEFERHQNVGLWPRAADFGRCSKSAALRGTPAIKSV